MAGFTVRPVVNHDPLSLHLKHIVFLFFFLLPWSFCGLLLLASFLIHN